MKSIIWSPSVILPGVNNANPENWSGHRYPLLYTSLLYSRRLPFSTLIMTEISAAWSVIKAASRRAAGWKPGGGKPWQGREWIIRVSLSSTVLLCWSRWPTVRLWLCLLFVLFGLSHSGKLRFCCKVLYLVHFNLVWHNLRCGGWTFSALLVVENRVSQVLAGRGDCFSETYPIIAT